MLLVLYIYMHITTTTHNSAKALYRRGYAHAAKKDWDKAEIDLDDAAAITPGDAAIVSSATHQLRTYHQFKVMMLRPCL